MTVSQHHIEAAREAVGRTAEDRAEWLLHFCRGPVPREKPDPSKALLECALFAEVDELPSLRSVQTFHAIMGRGLRLLERRQPWDFDISIQGQLTSSGHH